MIDTLPRFADHFPKLRRGHGSMHRDDRYKRVDGHSVLTHKGNPCISETCALKHPKSKDVHWDQAANRKDWEKERGLDRR